MTPKDDIPNQEIQILKDVYGLHDIDDPEQLRAAIIEKEAQMNALDRLEVQMRIGRKVHEAKNSSPRNRYSPSNWSLVVTSLLLLSLCAIATAWIVKTEAWMVFKVLAALIALVLFIAAWRAAARVIYRSVNDKDF